MVFGMSMPKRSRTLASLWTLLICVLTIYAPVELTRVILVGLEFWSRPVWHFMLEIAFIWVAYLIAMILVYKRTK